MATLPFLGLGLSTNLSVRDVPQPYRLLDAHPGAFDFVEYSAPLSLEETKETASLFEEMWKRRDQIPALFHPVHLNLYGPTLEPAEALKALDAHLRAVGSPWLGNDVGWWHEGGQPFPGYLYLPPPLDAAGLADAAAHALHVQSHVSVPLVLENPAVIAQRGPMHVLDFMAELHARTRLPLLLDLGHLLSYQLSRGLEETAGLDGFPLEQVVEVHLAGGVVTRAGERAFYVDDHTQPIREELFHLLELMSPRLTGLRALTFEGDGHPPEIALRTLRRLRRMLPERRPPLAVDPPASPVPLTGASRPWELFAERHGAKPASEDGEGTRAELDFRLAVIAESLDRVFPFSRLLLLGSREALVGFARSEAFRGIFEGAGRTLESAYLAHARQRARELGEEPVAGVLAFEQWAHGLFGREARDTHGALRIAPDVRVGQFALDLSELQFAVRALRRHLGQRAWASERLECSGLESLLQVARRASPGPWTVAVRRQDATLNVHALSVEETKAVRAAAAGEDGGAELEPGAVAHLRGLGVLL